MITRSAVFVFLTLLLAGLVQAVERGHPAKAKVTQVDRDQKVLSLKIKNYFFYLKILCFLEAIFVDLDLREVVPDGST